MTDIELEMRYVADRLAGRLKGCYHPNEMTDEYDGSLAFKPGNVWWPLRRIEQFTQIYGVPYKDKYIIDMPYSEYKLVNCRQYLFDIPEVDNSEARAILEMLRKRNK